MQYDLEVDCVWL